MAIQNARMQQKRGEEFNFDPDKMLPGEWAVSTDTKYVRMCFSPGVCVRMATYEAFEADMAQITAILEEAKTVQEAVEKINLEISDKLNAVIEYSEQTKQYRDEAEQFRNEAFSATPDGYENLVQNVTENTVKIDTIIEKAELNIKNSASGENIHLTDSANSKVVEFGLYGKATQDGEPTPDNPIDIIVSGSDGSVEVVSKNEDSTQSTNAIIPTPDGLAGIEVSSGGNYTDENGQQWICDEVVKYADGSGKRIERIGKAVFDGSDDEAWASSGTNQTGKYRYITKSIENLIKPTQSNSDKFVGLSNIFNVTYSGGTGTWGAKTGVSCDLNGSIFIYSDNYNTSDVSLWKLYLAENPMILYYELATPIITDLTAEEIAEIEKLHTFYPITNISNDADCGMSITYLADSKNYIDGQLAIQKDQQEEALVTMLLLMPEEVQASMIENDTNNLLNESEV